MAAIFLSASVPVQGRGTFYESADFYLIQLAVRELVVTTLGRLVIVWGGHPAITPMVWAACEYLGVDVKKTVLLYQSKFFEGLFPRENDRFANIIFTDSVDGDREKSLLEMRSQMLSRNDYCAAVFIGGMEGIFSEYAMFHKMHPEATILPVPSPGGAAKDLAVELGVSGYDLERIDYANLFHEKLGIPH